MRALVLMLCVASTAALAQVERNLTKESPRNMLFEFKLGPYLPLIDRDPGLAGNPVYKNTFGTGPMLLGEIEVGREFFQKMGTLGVGISGGYAEKFAKAVISGTASLSADATGLHVVPLKAHVVYRFDWLALNTPVPLVPYVKGGVTVSHWWITKGDALETTPATVGATAGTPAVGWSYGMHVAPGIEFLMDFLDPRLARDFDTGIGVNHTYIFAEFVFQEVNDFGRTNATGGRAALDLSSRHVMFGINLEY